MGDDKEEDGFAVLAKLWVRVAESNAEIAAINAKKGEGCDHNWVFDCKLDRGNGGYKMVYHCTKCMKTDWNIEYAVG